MKLHAKMTSERGKEVTKSGNEVITLTLTENREQRFIIMYGGERLEILNFRTGKIEHLYYHEQADIADIPY